MLKKFGQIPEEEAIMDVAGQKHLLNVFQAQYVLRMTFPEETRFTNMGLQYQNIDNIFVEVVFSVSLHLPSWEDRVTPERLYSLICFGTATGQE